MADRVKVIAATAQHSEILLTIFSQSIIPGRPNSETNTVEPRPIGSKDSWLYFSTESTKPRLGSG